VQGSTIFFFWVSAMSEQVSGQVSGQVSEQVSEQVSGRVGVPILSGSESQWNFILTYL